MRAAATMGQGRVVFQTRLQNYMLDCLRYEDRASQDAALRTIPVEELEEKTLVALAKEGKPEVSDLEFQHARLQQLLWWFKSSFKWVNQPPCERCGGESDGVGNGVPSPDERKWLAGRVELFRCKLCFSEVRFPRYNHPVKLLETRRGRCGEWANCFTLCCRALGYDARLVHDFEDHVWTECYSPLLGRWVHTDPCEGVLDSPLLYEKGWKKKLSYAIALNHNGVYDVTRRYTRNWPQVLTRRTMTSEEEAQEVVMLLKMQMRGELSSEEWDELAALDAIEEEEIDAAYRAATPSEAPLPGRQSGAQEWRVARGEIGDSEASAVPQSECPVRLCVDEHVRAVREAVGRVWSDVLKAEQSIQKVLLGLKALHAFLAKLKDLPMRHRELELDPQSQGVWLKHCSEQTVNSVLESLNLQRLPKKDGELWVAEASSPVQTALALPVALELLERLSADVPSIAREKWLVNGSRICKGSSSASGLEGSVGISSVAFDGLISTKWEEPNGAEGRAWIVYQLPDGKRETLAAYEITSANDVPARDPRDWVLEGSADLGRSWRTLDGQQGQIFYGRFVTKTYEIAPENHSPCDSFRLRVLATKSRVQNGRLQIGCIELLTARRAADPPAE